LVCVAQPPQEPVFRNALPVNNPPASINLTWSPPNMLSTDPPLTGYRIRFFIVDTPEDFTVNVGLQMTYLQSGLIPNRAYRFEIAAVNLIGIGPVSPPPSFMFETQSGEGSM